MFDQLLETLSSLLPAESKGKLEESVKAIVAQAEADAEAKYEAKLAEERGKFAGELQLAESTAVEGYQKALVTIRDLERRIELVKGEKDKEALENYEEAFNQVKALTEERDALEAKFAAAREEEKEAEWQEMVTLVDAYLQNKERELLEQARRDVLNDPRMVEHRVAVDRVIESVGSFLKDGSYASVATSRDLTEAKSMVEDLRAQLRKSTSEKLALSGEVKRLAESVRAAERRIDEAQAESKKAMKALTESVEGKGVVVETARTVAEPGEGKGEAQAAPAASPSQMLIEGVNLEEMKYLAGTN